MLLLAVSARAEDTVVGPNLVKNPSFEQSPADARLPASWSGDTSVYSICRDVAHSGAVSLKYVNADANRYRLATQKLNLIPGQKYRISAWVKTEDLQGQESGATICLEWSDATGKHMGGIYPGGPRRTSDWKHVEACARVPKEARSFGLACYARNRMTGTAWFDDVEVVRVIEKPMRSVVLAPRYRGRITSEGPDKVRVHLAINLLDYDLRAEQLSVAMQLTDDSGHAVPLSGQPAGPPIVERALFAKGNETELAYPVDKLTPGMYQLTLQLLGPDGQEMQTVSHVLRRVPDDFRPKCTIDSHDRVIVEGKPFFPLGMYWGGINEDDLKVYSKSKFNCLMPYGSPKPEQMDLAQRYGLKVIYSIKDWYYGSHYCPADIRSKADEEPKVRDRVRRFRNHPALLAWYLNDELPETYIEQLNAHQRWVAEEDPDHPTWVVLCHPSDVGDYINSFDVIGTDPYPIGRQPASNAAAWTVETRRQVCGARPLWQVPQVFNWVNYHKDAPKPEYRTPTAEEMRSMAWQCITEGASGLVFYSWSDIHRNPDVPFNTQWERLTKIVEEIDRFAPLLLSVDPALTVSAETPGWLHWTARAKDGKLYLFAVNDGDGEGAVRFKLPKTPKQVQGLLADTQPKLDGSVIEDQSKRFGFQVYEIAW